MKRNRIQILMLFFVLPILAFTSVHKFYVTLTQIEYVQEKNEVQIMSRIFIDDMEKLIRQRYDATITLADVDESEKVDVYISKYLKEKLAITINGEAQALHFIGKAYEDDMLLCYLGISEIESIESIEVSNRVLFDIYEEQQNVIRTKINSKNKSFILIPENDKALLNFNKTGIKP